MKIGLVTATITQAEGPLAAQKLYRSPLFLAAADYCVRQYQCWFILSWEHGLLLPEQVIFRSEEIQACRGLAERRRWSEDVLHRLHDLDLSEESFFLHTEPTHAELLLPILNAGSPVRSLTEEDQLNWYESHRRVLSFL
jgi:hypothetical protein